jgi:hypothetical protein
MKVDVTSSKTQFDIFSLCAAVFLIILGACTNMHNCCKK